MESLAKSPDCLSQERGEKNKERDKYSVASMAGKSVSPDVSSSTPKAALIY